MLIGSESAGAKAAILSVIETCRQFKIDVRHIFESRDAPTVPVASA